MARHFLSSSSKLNNKSMMWRACVWKRGGGKEKDRHRERDKQREDNRERVCVYVFVRMLLVNTMARCVRSPSSKLDTKPSDACVFVGERGRDRERQRETETNRGRKIERVCVYVCLCMNDVSHHNGAPRLLCVLQTQHQNLWCDVCVSGRERERQRATERKRQTEEGK